MVNNVPQMNELRLSETIKTRVEPNVKEALADIAKKNHLKPSDIQRQAFRDYLTSIKSRSFQKQSR